MAKAPGAVASFALLARRHFCGGLYFYRVVPNFVAQGNDLRGDGSGSPSYTAQPGHDAGVVGLTLAGQNTKASFFTHLPTPRPNGRYPIFAQAVSGPDVGDCILTATLPAASPLPPAWASKNK